MFQTILYLRFYSFYLLQNISGECIDSIEMNQTPFSLNRDIECINNATDNIYSIRFSFCDSWSVAIQMPRSDIHFLFWFNYYLFQKKK